MLSKVSEGLRIYYLCDPTFSCFDTIPECNRCTDWRWQHISR